MKNNSKPTAQIVRSSNRLLDDLHDIVAQAETLLKDTVSDKTEESVASLRQLLASSREGLEDIFRTTKKQAVAGVEHADAGIRSHPYQSVAVAAGVALICGLLLRGSSK